MSLVIMTSGVDTNTHTHKYTRTYFGSTKVISRNQAHAWFKNSLAKNPLIFESVLLDYVFTAKKYRVISYLVRMYVICNICSDFLR